MKSLLSLLLPESIFRRMINANPGLVSMTTYLPCLYLNLELGLACLRITRSWRPFRESADNVLGPKNYFVCCVCIHDESFNNFDNDTMKLWVNEEKLTGLCARNCVTIRQVLICCVCVHDESFNNFDNDTMKLSVKKKNWPVYELQELLLFNRFDFEFAFGPEKLPGLSRNGRLIIFNPLTPDMYTQIL